MDISVDVWLRGDNHATTEVIAPVAREAREWTETDVVAVLQGMLRALERAKNPGAAADRPVALRGFSWIVSPFESGGVVIALELTLGAVVAGPDRGLRVAPHRTHGRAADHRDRRPAHLPEHGRKGHRRR